MADRRIFAPAAARNRDAILAVLRTALPEAGLVLEIASGSGEHVVHFAAALPALTFQPTDRTPEALDSIAAWIEGADATNIRAPALLDVLSPAWPVERADAILCINMIHISPWRATQALFAGARRLPGAGAPLVLYGPYRRGGRHTAPSNAEFDASLRARDPEWGVRDLEAVAEVATAAGFGPPEAIEMPANNFVVVFRKAV